MVRSDGLPETLEEAVQYVINKLPDEYKQKLREMKEKDSVLQQFVLGMGIRNELKLWVGNDALLKSCGKTHPDDASGVIIEAIVQELKKEK